MMSVGALTTIKWQTCVVSTMLLYSFSSVVFSLCVCGCDDKSRSSVLFVCVFRYVERKNFLERVDHRQFELEKAVRLSNMKR